MKFLGLIFVLGAWLNPCFSLDREAFTFTRYDLEVRVEPQQQRLGVRGKITLRNDSPTSQKNLVLQISSTLEWRSIQVGGKPVQFVTQPYLSDIDHTGSVSEAIVNLPTEVPPQAKVEVEIGYEGTVPLDVTRLKRIGVPEDAARHTDWDQISASSSAVRGIGYVAWYPVATDSADLTDPDSLFAIIGNWIERELSADFRVNFCVLASRQSMQTAVLNDPPPAGVPPGVGGQIGSDGATLCQEHEYSPLGRTAPAFAVAPYTILSRDTIDVYQLGGHSSGAEDYALAAELAAPFVESWFGKQRQKARTVDVVDPQAAPYESGSLLFTPLVSRDVRLAQLTAVHQLTHASFPSPRAWIYEGLAHFAQAAFREQQSGRQAALDYMGLHRTAVADVEKTLPAANQAANSLINTSVPELYRSKAMYVWWMLRDMVGEATLKKVVLGYRAEDDRSPSYVQRLLEKESRKDLEWFFDDWVYRDRGLPDFRVASVIPRATLNGASVLTITIENLGGAGAEVTVIVRMQNGEVTQRVVVPARGKASLRIEAVTPAQEVVVNDGSVPETDLSNNVFKIEEH